MLNNIESLRLSKMVDVTYIKRLLRVIENDSLCLETMCKFGYFISGSSELKIFEKYEVALH